MASSLASQLQRLAAQPSAMSGQRTAPSLLFDWKEAGDLDLETVLALGANGLAELVQLDPEFARFEQPLFSAATKDLDRALQTAEVNAQLDETITEFVLMLSPHFLLKPAQKALEWLVRRFRLGEFNGEALLKCVLPYHETNLFVRVVQLIQLKKLTQWQFLTTIRKSGSPLARETLVQRCETDPSVLVFVCQTMQEQVKLHRNPSTWAAFYCATLVAYIRALHRINNTVIQALVPYLVAGLKAKDSRDFQLGTYMILAQLAAATSLPADVVHSFITTIAKNIGPQTPSKDALLAVLLLVQAQRPTEITTEAVNCLLKFNNFVDIVVEVSAAFEASHFLTLVINKLLELNGSSKAHDQALVGLIKRSTISVDAVKSIMDTAFDLHLKAASSQEALVKVLRILQTQYPLQIDQLIEDQLKVHPENSAESAKVFELASSAFQGTRHEPLADAGTTLFLSTQHPDSTIRLKAVQAVAGQDVSSEEQLEFVRDILVARIADDSDEVAAFVLDLPNLLELVPVDTVVRAVLDRLHQGLEGKLAKTKSYALLARLLKTGAELEQDQFLEIEELLLQNILATTKNAKSAKQIHSVLRQIKGSSTAGHLNLANASDESPAVVIAHLAANITQDGNSSWIELAQRHIAFVERSLVAKKALTKVQVRGVLACLLALAQTWQTLTPKQRGSSDAVDVNIQLLALISSVWTHAQEHVEADIAENVNAQVQAHLEGNELPAALYESIIAGSADAAVLGHAAAALATSLVLALEENPTNASLFLPKLFGFLASHRAWRSLLARLFGHVVVHGHLAFLTGIATAEVAQVGGATIAQALRVLQTFLVSSTTKEQQEPRNPALLLTVFALALSSPVTIVRSSGLQGITAVHKLLQAFVQTAAAGSSAPSSSSSSSSKGKKKPTSGAEAPHIPWTEVFGADVENGFVASAEASVALLDLCMARSKSIEKDRGYFSVILKDLAEADSSSAKQIVKMFASAVSVLSSAASKNRLLRVLYASETTSMGLDLLVTHIDGALVSLSENAPATAADDRLDTIRLILSGLHHKNNGADHLVKCLKSKVKLTAVNAALGTPCDIALSSLQPAYFASVGPQTQVQIFEALCELLLASEQPTTTLVRTTLRSLKIPSELLLSLLASLKEDIANFILSAASSPIYSATEHTKDGKDSKRRKNASSSADAVETVLAPPKPENLLPENILERLISGLEVIELVHEEAKNSVEILAYGKALVPVLFDIFADILQLKSKASLEYVQQLVLSCLLAFSTDQQKLKKSEQLDERVFRVDTVVQCIRGSESPQTHHHALLLLATIASLHADRVLASIMPIFTFMGANVLRQDDQYSFAVIKQTVEQILPPLVAKQSKADVKLVIKVFVDALFHIPKHRRLRLFSILVTTLGEKLYLHVVGCLLVERSVEITTPKDDESSGNEEAVDGDADSLKEFWLVLSVQFNTHSMINALVQMVEQLSLLPNDPPAVQASASLSKKKSQPAQLVQQPDNILFDLINHSGKQLRKYKSTCIEWISETLQTQQIQNLKKAKGQEDKTLLPLLECLVALLTSASAVSRDLTQPAQIAKFIKDFATKTSDVMEQVNALLSVAAFVQVITHLIHHKDALIRRRALALLNERVKTLPTAILEDDTKQFVAIIPDLEALIGQADTKDTASTKQTSLLTYEILLRKFGSSQTELFVKTMPSVLKCINSPRGVAAISYMCLAGACNVLGARFLPYVPLAVQGALSTIEGSIVDPSSYSAHGESLQFLQHACLTFIDEALSTLPQFMSPFIPRVVRICLHPSIVNNKEASNAAQTQLLSKVKSAMDHVASSIAPRVSLPKLFELFRALVSEDTPKSVLVGVMVLVGQIIARFDRAETVQYCDDITSFFIDLFALRARSYPEAAATNNHWTLSMMDADAVEYAFLDAFLELVMKLNETLFKPLLVKTIAWHEGVSADNNELARNVFYYRLTDKMAFKLKAIFVPFSGPVLNDIAATLGQLHLVPIPPPPQSQPKDKKRKSESSSSAAAAASLAAHEIISSEVLNLWRAMIDTVSKLALYDIDGFIDRERFDVLVEPLTSQLDSPLLTGLSSSDYLDEMRNHLADCIGQIAVCVNQEPMWKILNHKVLLKSRSPLAHVRLASLYVVKEFYNRLAEEFLVLLPETIPFLAELLEDDDENVEKACQELVADIEQLLGEPIKKYFQ